MTVEEGKAILEQNLQGMIVAMTTGVRRIFLTVDVANLIPACKVAKDKMGYTHVTTITARDTGSAIDVLYHLTQKGLILTIKVSTDRDKPSVTSITPLFPGAVMYERECHDILNVDVVGHPDMRRLVLPDDWPEGVFPLRKDWHLNRTTGVIV